MSFACVYDFGASARFTRTILAPVRGVDTRLAIGAIGGGALAARIGDDGAFIWARSYSMGDARVSFHDGCAVGGDPRQTNAGFVLLGTVHGGRDGPHLLVRIDADGKLIWARCMDAGQGDGPSQVVAARSGGVLVVAQARPEEGGINLIRVGADGALKRAVSINARMGEMLVDALASADGFRVIARFDAGGAVFSIADAPEGQVQAVTLIAGAHGVFTPTAATAGDDGAIVVLGSLPGAERHSAIVDVTDACQRADAKVAHGCRYAAANGRDDPACLARSGGGYLALERAPSAPSIVRFAASLRPEAQHVVDLASASDVAHMTSDGANVSVCGTYVLEAGGSAPLALGAKADLECCRIGPPQACEARAFDVSVSPLAAAVRRRRMRLSNVSPRVGEHGPSIRSLCGGGIGSPASQRMVQSPFLLLQAAGSTGADAARGVLLRWHLLGALGDSHLPKGDLQPAATFFNKQDDYVAIYRGPWPQNAPTRRLDFREDRPVHVDAANGLHIHRVGAGATATTFYVHFRDPAAYAMASAAANPSADLSAFLSAYGDKLVEVEIRGVLAMHCDIELSGSGASLKVETLSVGEHGTQAAKTVTSRRTIVQPSVRLTAENMRSVRYVAQGGIVAALSFTCYDDIFAVLNDHVQWTALGRYALTTNRAVAFDRLEAPQRFKVDGVWRKFNDGAHVKVANYQSRWDAPQGVGDAVQAYIQLSAADARANAEFQGADPHDGKVSFSYLDLLQLAALDFHVARMLGLGSIDTSAREREQYVYLAEYFTAADLQDGGGARSVQHLYMSLQTSLEAQRMPPAPELAPVQYGLSVPTANGQPYWLTDPEGYTSDGAARYVRISAMCKPLHEKELGPFNPTSEFDLSTMTLPVFYGVEYRRATDQAWRRPELGCDKNYIDATGHSESAPTPFPAAPGQPPFLHRETDAGVHEYAAYSVNIFSRASPCGDIVATDATSFTKPNRLLPPGDLRAQLIQSEWPLLLTTQEEQDLLAARKQAGGDATLVRVTFNYAHVQEQNYAWATRVELFHRLDLPRIVIGAVKAVNAGSDPSLLQIETKPYVYFSTSEVVTPTITDKSSFIGGVLVVAQTRLVIVDVLGLGANPTFVVRKPAAAGATDTGVGASLVIEDTTPQIHSGDLCMAIENMAAASSWGDGEPLTAVVQIGDASWSTQAESFIDVQGVAVSRTLRGVWGTADVVEEPAGSGCYRITFASYVLPPHPQSGAANPVAWHKGIVRVPVAGAPSGDRRALEVVAIDKAASGALTLIACDDSGDALAVAVGLQTVNYFPGYKVYLYADTARGFTQSVILPNPGEGSRMSVLAVRSVDATTLDAQGKAYRSQLSPPQLLLAQEVIEPNRPAKPGGLDYATPPDAANKSTYTLDLNFVAPPYAFIVCRADALSLLRMLYKPSTLADVRARVLPPKDGAFFKERFEDLFDFDNYPAASKFRPFALEDGEAYELPRPDAPAFSAHQDKAIAAFKDEIKEALLRAFAPLTEQPLIHSLIRANPDYLPTNAPQKFRNANGDLLAPGAPGFDLAPMAVKLSPTNVRFVDFTLDGSMNPDTVYFYFCQEIGSRMDMGEASAVFGPVKLVNTSPPSTPSLRRLFTTPFDVETGVGPRVTFEFLAPADIDPIASVRIYRTSNELEAVGVRTMPMIKEAKLADLVVSADGACVVVDDFAGEPFPPYGEPLFYRLAFVREAHYRDAQQSPKIAFAASPPTRLFVANVVDVVPPEPPAPVVHAVALLADGGKLVTLQWPKTVHNGTYHVARLSNAGVWTRVGSVKDNDAQVSFALPEGLQPTDEDGSALYCRLRVDVENSSGVCNIIHAPITLDVQAL